MAETCTACILKVTKPGAAKIAFQVLQAIIYVQVGGRTFIIEGKSIRSNDFIFRL